MMLLFRHKVYIGVKYWGSIALHTFSYNILLSGALIGKYININLPSFFAFSENSLYIQISQILFILLMGTMGFSQLMVRVGFSGTLLSGKIKKNLFIITASLLMSISIGSVFLYKGFSSADFFLESLGDLLFLTEFFILILILFDSRKNRDKRQFRLMRSYSLLYLSRYPLILLMLVIPESIKFYSAMTILFYLNMIPLIWSLIFFGKGSMTEKSGSLESSEVTEQLKRYNITARESQVIKLLLSGKSNCEIEEILFISSHTVKNHIYNIYKKMSVKTRYELISLLT
ncbi:MAG: helix-turn-helix transcriptional regulator [Spirochaetales bacterium]|nr:helix-turn-helix transcriptional regulator [Spirochaetales bacterium]